MQIDPTKCEATIETGSYGESILVLKLPFNRPDLEGEGAFRQQQLSADDLKGRMAAGFAMLITNAPHYLHDIGVTAMAQGQAAKKSAEAEAEEKHAAHSPHGKTVAKPGKPTGK